MNYLFFVWVCSGSRNAAPFSIRLIDGLMLKASSSAKFRSFCNPSSGGCKLVGVVQLEHKIVILKVLI